MDDYYCVEEFSDNEVVDSSSDDEDFKSLFTFNEDSVDFETEMERERMERVNHIYKQNDTQKPSTSSQQTTSEDGNDKQNVKTDSNETNTAINDELLYDPKADENDQKWVDNHRLVATTRTEKGTVGKSDATLNCPACLTLLCHDCQRHDIYRTQYRAMFVYNCRINFTERLQFKDKQQNKRKSKVERSRKTDDYYPVFCNICNTRVAVYDNDEVYHFFSVLASF
ncbi:E2F-associated phosphoprotein-like [Oppia nitens]|uniref:E2F-associated phosphoprotein-like n=1 Tax=Oppia nitens TaxID=1686743 RepID=UPI0023D9D1A6|nr:E2F-associated phosphoprotein-like [Oppia nitens]